MVSVVSICFETYDNSESFMNFTLYITYWSTVEREDFSLMLMPTRIMNPPFCFVFCFFQLHCDLFLASTLMWHTHQTIALLMDIPLMFSPSSSLTWHACSLTLGLETDDTTAQAATFYIKLLDGKSWKIAPNFLFQTGVYHWHDIDEQRHSGSMCILCLYTCN